MVALAAVLGFALIFAAALSRERDLARQRDACWSGNLEACEKACGRLNEGACRRAQDIRSARAARWPLGQ